MNANNAYEEARSAVEGICHFERSEKSSPSVIASGEKQSRSIGPVFAERDHHGACGAS